LAPRRSRESFEIVEQFAQPIYVLFFVIVGARLYIGGMQWWLWVLAVVYVIGRTAGKMLGANLGARFSGATESVRKYLGLCLFSQAGVAIGLSILASMSFSPKIGGAIIMIVTATTLLVQIIGPPCVKLAVKKAGEIGLDVTEEDLMRSYKVRDVVNRTTPTFHENSRLGDILRTIAQTDAMSYPVIDAEGKLVGIITIEELKRSFVDNEMTNWLLAYDLMRPVPDVIEQDAPLIEAITRMREQNLSYIPVVESRDNPRLVGMLELSAVERYLSGEVIRRRQLAGT
ncbi:MAG: CBS domain-containing protein, partial [Planctomycetes bacterium]|nr:CBS domain-containing protein [Planctomycetota bacterium]